VQQRLSACFLALTSVPPAGSRPRPRAVYSHVVNHVVQEDALSVQPLPPPVPPSRRGPTEQRRADAVDRLLTSLEDLVRRHRALAVEERHVPLHAELVTAEVAHELALTRSYLQRHPPLKVIS
jgi:hypothetical protein